MLNETLKQIRLFHQMKQSVLAEKLGISKSYLSELETNKKNVSLEILKKYSDYFSVPVSSLMIFSENLSEAKKSDKFRITCASKILKILEWVNARHKE